METKQTAIDWLIEELGEYFPHEIGGIHLMVEKAKQIEKEQIIRAFGKIQRTSGYDDKGNFIISDITAEHYYEKTYGKAQ